MQLSLNTAYAWSSKYKTPVELVLHWSDYASDVYYHPEDTEKLGERITVMDSKMRDSGYPVTITHEWDSGFFGAAKSLKDYDAQIRHKIEYQFKQIFIETTETERLDFDRLPFEKQGCAEWQYNETPIEKKVIAFWDYGANAEPVKNYKSHGWDTEIWNQMYCAVHRYFPEHKVIRLSYRDPFDFAYRVIRKSDFIVGYDGMWHMTARNFGKVFVSYTGDPYLAHRMTNPNAIHHCQTPQFVETLIRLRNPTELQWEKDYALAWHKHRMGLYL